ncbi:MAG: DNA topoisomerase [Oscillospiraceae bacterium]|nr:DNA topoisomerase [Oscillospiraceae bacterium]MCL2278641.1 DNA topoisomerase [Oscillospiraceae bacterium]
MGYKLCITEKPSVAGDIARVVGANAKHKGYYEGNGYLVTYAIGHLVSFAEPEAYGYVRWHNVFSSTDVMKKAFDELPLLPSSFKLVVNESTRHQFNVIKSLMTRSDIDYVVDCGDMGPEGHVLQQMIRDKLNCKLPVKRFCATSLTDAAIQSAMVNLRSISEFRKIVEGQYCKKKADWILGMSASRAMSLRHRKHIAVGRVMSPTLYFIVKRHLEIFNFKESNYFIMKAMLKEGFCVSWSNVSNDLINLFAESELDSENRVLSKSKLTSVADKIRDAGIGKILDVVKKRKKTNCPQLYDTTDLQKDANRIYGYSATLTLSAAQSLYETHKVISYPRTDSKYITDDLAELMESRVSEIATIPKYSTTANALLSKGLIVNKRVLDNSKVTDHHAIIPTENICNFVPNNLHIEKNKTGLTGEVLANVLALVLLRTLVAFSSPYVYDNTVVDVEFNDGFVFSVTTNSTISLGWKDTVKQLSELADDEDDFDPFAQSVPELVKGQIVTVADCVVESKKTSPPKLHTDGTLLTAMQNAGSVLGADGAILKGKGIGTQASQDEIINKIIKSGAAEYVNKGKFNYIKPTDYGIGIIRELPEELRSPKITADWELMFDKIVSGESDEHKFMEAFEDFILRQIEYIKNSEPSTAFIKDKEVFGSCPWCSTDVYESAGKNNKAAIAYYCSGYKSGCSWKLNCDDNVFNVFIGRKLKKQEALHFIENGQIDLVCNNKGYKSKKTFEFVKKVSGNKTFCNIMVS